MDYSAKRYEKSIRAFRQASRYLAGGVNSPVRAFTAVPAEPIFIASARGSKIYDIDGNEYIDYVCSWGPMLLGHCHPAVVKAVSRAAQKGLSFGAPTVAESELAEKIVSAFSSIRKVRLLNSGTEAVMTAVRLARGYTGRDLIVKMAGAYHGHSDSLLVQSGSAAAEGTVASSAGVPGPIAGLTKVLPYNDIDAVEKVFQQNKGEIAAVLVEPIAANMGVIPPVEGYLDRLGRLCSENGSLLIFDEVITGFRLAPGGAQQYFGVNADITCLGKIIGGGLPLAAIGGRADIMDMLAPAGPVYQAGTLSGNPLATAAANATLERLCGRSYEKLEYLAGLLEAGLSQAAEDTKTNVRINRAGSLMSCFFTDKEVNNFADVQATDIAAFKKFFLEMLCRGIYLAPSAYEAMFVSLAHTPDDIEKTVQAAEESFRNIKKG